MKLSQLTQARPLDTVVDVFGDPIHATIDRARVGTKKYYDFKTWREQLGYMLIAWDTTDDDGTPLLPDEKAPDRVAAWVAIFEPIPDAILLPFWRELIDQSRLGKTAGGG
jgi:hypothetical protein